MLRIPFDHILILPHADEYRRFFEVSESQVFDCLNIPDHQKGLNIDHYTAEKELSNRRLYVYYFLTYPLSAQRDEVYAIVDFVGCSELADSPTPISSASSRKRSD